MAKRALSVHEAPPSEESGAFGAAIARARMNEPSVLLAGEPTGNLDTATSTDFMRLFDKL